jgi:hypothetical protein
MTGAPDRPGEGAALMQTSNRARPATVVQHAAWAFKERPAQSQGPSSEDKRLRPTDGGLAWRPSPPTAPGADGQTSNRHAVQEGGIACLDALAAQLHARGWAAYINAPAGRLTSLVVQDPRDRAERGDIIAAPAGPAGTWWYWFSWAERIAPVGAPAAAADAIIRAFQRPADAAVVPLSGE